MQRIFSSFVALTIFAGTLPLQAEENTETIEVTTVRGLLGEVNPLEHTRGQLRAGYIRLQKAKNDTEPDTSAIAVGGHLHLDSKRWHGLMVGIEGYFVADPGINEDNPDRIHDDFFDRDKKGFATLSQAFLDGRWETLEFRAGRQMLDTPHADSDDIRMMPNYFQAYLLSGKAGKGFSWNLGKIDRMAGWENGVDAGKFVPVAKSMGTDRKTDGLYMASLSYEGFENLSVQGWFYLFDDIAETLYLELAYELSLSRATLTLGLQYDRAKESGKALLGDIESSTYGASVKIALSEWGPTFLAAYNADDGETGAFGSLGGGPFFTSLEDQTIDGIGEKGSAWIVGVGYDMTGVGTEGLYVALVHGHFDARDRSKFRSRETDVIVEYAPDERFSVSFAYASIDDGSVTDADYRQLRFILNYNFFAM